MHNQRHYSFQTHSGIIFQIKNNLFGHVDMKEFCSDDQERSRSVGVKIGVLMIIIFTKAL